MAIPMPCKLRFILQLFRLSFGIASSLQLLAMTFRNSKEPIKPNMKYIFVYPLISAILAALYRIGCESFIRYFGDYSLAMAITINISGGLFLFLFIPNKKRSIKKIPPKDFLLLFIASFFAFGLSYLLLYKAIDLIGASKVSFLAQAECVFIIVLSILLLKEKLKLREFLGFFVISSGILLLNFNTSLFSFSFGFGEIYALSTYLAFAIGVITISKLVKKYDPIYLTSLEMILGGIILSLFLIANPVSIQLSLILLLFPLGFILSLAWLAYNLGLKNIGASKTAIIYSLQSFFTLTFSYYAMKIFPSLGLKIPTDLPTFLAAGVIMFLGIVILETGKQK